MQVADNFEVLDMLNAEELNAIVAKHQPDLIVPEIEAIRTERFYSYEQQSIQVVPSARAANFTMNRKYECSGKYIVKLAVRQFINPVYSLLCIRK